jgi:hypothetical protein
MTEVGVETKQENFYDAADGRRWYQWIGLMRELLCVAGCLVPMLLGAQVRLSEFMAANVQAHPDVVDFEDYPDWIELENTTDAPVSLEGWYLSDDPDRPLRWGFPATAQIPARGRLVVWADGYDAIPGETHPRGYWPWRSFTTEGYHANFSLATEGEWVVLSRVEGALGGLTTLVDQVAYGHQVDDVSMGRNGAGEWVRFADPSPGAPNGGVEVEERRVSGGVVTVEPEGGIHEGPLLVTLSASEGTIRYTLDGSLPSVASVVYGGPLTVATTVVVRARVFMDGRPNGPVATHTYFIGEDPGGLPYVSVVADPERLFGERVGIYHNQHEPLVSSSSNAARGLRDVYKGKDAPGSLEFYPPAGGVGFRVRGGYRMGGENNWVHSQRALNFVLRGRYGDDAIGHDLFPGSGIPRHGSVTLREGGDAWDKEMLRDGFWAVLGGSRMRLGFSEYRPSVVFINGVYWGIHNVRSRWDDTWFFERHRVGPGEVDHLMYGHLTSGSVTLGADKGDTAAWLALLETLRGQDLQDAEVWAEVERRVDLDSFIDFIVAEAYGLNTSWRHNREFWRPRVAGGRWQWLLPDMDQTFRRSALGSNVLQDMLGRDELLVLLKGSAVFRHRLAQRFAAQVSSTLQASRLKALLADMAAEVESEVERHAARWSALGGMTVDGRVSYLRDMRLFIDARETGVLGEVERALGLSGGAVEVDLTVMPAGAGEVRVEGVPMPTGVVRFFSGIPTRLEAIPAPGYRWSGWQGVEGGASLTVALEEGATVTAVFEPADETVVGGVVLADTTWTSDGTPYVIVEDVVVPAGVTLTIGPGVTVQLAAGRHVRVQGELRVEGSADLPVRMEGRNGARWGGLSFEQPTGTSTLRHLVVRGATRGADPVDYPYAISGLNASLVMEDLDVEHCDGPIFCRGGEVILRRSRLHMSITGDCINVKQGRAVIEDCDFFGNEAVDTDAIDYDGVVNGVIRDSRIYRFAGPNCDGIDIGEACVDVRIENNRIYDCFDKGVSIGQGSTVVMRHNLLVGCGLGVGIKDDGSRAWVDRNTMVRCGVGVDVYEKSYGEGGGEVEVTSTVISKSSVAPVRMDAWSEATVVYSLSDTTAMPGEGNLLGDPRFVDPGWFNFEFRSDSPVRDAGDPAQGWEEDGSRADMGAAYEYRESDYPFEVERVVVMDELLANSGAGADWMELFNRSVVPVDISGWFLSDSMANLRKYRIPEGTVLEPGGRVVFDEHRHFGESSLDPGRWEAFALSDAGETVYLSSAEEGVLTGYQAQESFGPSLPGETLGNHYKASTDSWNFVPMERPTPGEANSLPRVGPVVISEVHFAPAQDAEAEFLELLNVTGEEVSFYDADRGAGWRMTDGIEWEFPVQPPVVLGPGERLVLVKDRVRFAAMFTVPPGTQVLEWTGGRLANEGEMVQLARPAGLDDDGVRQFARVDRVRYQSTAPWPAGASATGRSLQKGIEGIYGNDPAPWVVREPTPGWGIGWEDFQGWMGSFDLEGSDRLPGSDPDRDGRSNLLEYALGGDPMRGGEAPAIRLGVVGGQVTASYEVRVDRSGVRVDLEAATVLGQPTWVPLHGEGAAAPGAVQVWTVTVPLEGTVRFFRLMAR